MRIGKAVSLLLLTVISSFTELQAKTEVLLPNNKASIVLDAGNSLLLNDYQIDPRERSGYWYASLNDRSITASIAFEPARGPGTAIDARNYYQRITRKQTPFGIKNERLSDDNGKAVAEYTSFSADKDTIVAKRNFNVYLVHGGYWINVHLVTVSKDKVTLDELNRLAHTVAINENAKYTAHYDLAYGSIFFQQENYVMAAAFYQRAWTAWQAKKVTDLSRDEWRILVDQLAVSYSLMGNQQEAKTVLGDGLKEDPAYPMFHYNMACAYAAEGNLADTLIHLEEAFKNRGNMIKGEKFPDLANNNAFRKYLTTTEFQDLMARYKY